MKTESDFAIVLSSNDDLSTRRYYPAAYCGGAFGVDLTRETHLFGGTGYSWVACVDGLTILHEWEHQFSAAMNYLLGFNSIYPVDKPQDYPPCGMGDPDIFRWFPDSEHWGVDPDSPWCGMTDSDKVGIAELHLFAHYDASLTHYPLGFFTGNHCNNGVEDLGETAVDQGGNCPAEAPVERIEELPSDDAWVQMRSSGNHGHDRQLRLQKNAKVAYLKFDLRDVQGDIASAALNVITINSRWAVVEVHAVSDTAWEEETLNGRNAPVVGELLDSVVIAGQSGSTISWDITSYIRAAVAAGSQEVSFALVMADGKPLSFSSKESRNADDAPLLVIMAQ
jgi:hypothetical protein